MAIIYTYPVQSNPESEDLLIGSDVTGKQTKNFTVESIASSSIPTYISGTVNKIPLFTEANVIGDSVITQNSSNIGIGTNNPDTSLHVVGNVKIETTGSVDNLLLTSTDATLTGAPDISLFADTAAADGDTIGNIQFRGRNGMAPGSTTPLTYAAFYSHIIDKDNNQSILALTGHKGNGSGANKTVANFSVIGANNSGEGAVLINPSSGYTPSSYNLEVNGDFKVVDNAYFDSNVGIGTTTPQRELDVNGGIRVRGPLDLFQSNDNTLAGQDAGNWYNITGSKNTAFGKNSQSVQVGGSQNTSVGYNSMAEATVGNLNVAIGDSAMASNDGGSFNTAVGALALQDQEAGQGNTAIGYQSLNNKDESNFNTAVGHTSLFNVSTGFKNIGIGDNVGLALSSGNKNVLIGSNANVVGANNANSIVIGADVMGNGNNTATIGNSAVKALHVGGNNAGIVLKSPDGTAYKITVDNGGSLVVTAV